jgi:competence protein ComEC
MSKNKSGKREEDYQKFWGIYLIPANFLSAFLSAFLGGVVVRSLWSSEYLFLFLMMFLLIILSFVFFGKNLSKKIFFVLFILLGVAVGIFRTDVVLRQSQNWLEGHYRGQGRVVRFSEVKDEYQKIYLEIVGAKMDGRQRAISQKEIVIFFAPIGVDYRYGDYYAIECDLKNPEIKYKKFNYPRFLASKKVYQICYQAKVRKIKKDENNFLIGVDVFLHRKIYRGGELLAEKINELFAMPESGYLAGLLLGGDSRLPEDVADDFRRTGMTHTVAVSGSNITIIATALLSVGLFFGLWRQQAFYLVIGGIIIFVVMIGAPASAVRAAIMAIVLFYASQSGRLADSLRVIVLTACLMVFVSPLLLLYDVGFQLSFLATLGIVLFYSPLAEAIGIENDFLDLKSIILVTVAAQLGVTGILVYTFDSISLLSLPANILILPFIPLIMAGGFGATVISFILPTLGEILSIPVQMFLEGEVYGIHHLAKISWASVNFGNVAVYWMGVYYFIILVLFKFLKDKIGKTVI